MGKRALSFLVLLACAVAPTPARAEDKVVLEDAFQDNHNKWIVTDAADHSTKLEKGRLILLNKGPQGAVITTVESHLHEDENYQIEATMVLTKIGTGTDDEFGIFFGAYKISDGLLFAIKPNGTFGFFTKKDNVWHNELSWTASSAIKQGLGASNTLVVRRVGERYYLDINGTNVEHLRVLPWKARAAGFYVAGPGGQLEVERFKIRETGPEVTILASLSGTKRSKTVVAVFEVQDAAGKLKKTTLVSLAEYLSALLAQKGAYSIVPTEQLRGAMVKTKAQSYKTCFDTSCQIELGKAVAAEAIVSTKILRAGDTCVVSTTLFDLVTETTVKAATSEGGCGDKALLDGIKTVAAQL